MHQNRQKSVKTSELEDRYAVIFSLALWPEKPREIDFFKKSWFSKKLSSKNYKKSSKWSWNGSPWLCLGWYLGKMDPNASRKHLEVLPGPGEAIFDQFWPKSAKNGQKKTPYIFRIFFRIFSVFFPYFSKGRAVYCFLTASLAILAHSPLSSSML